MICTDNHLSIVPHNLVLITSIIKIPNIPLSYTNIRSMYTTDERFEQTKYTIQTIREKIPNSSIILVECSDLDPHHLEYFHNHCNYFINIFETSRLQCYSQSKALGEATMTMTAIEYIHKYNIPFDSFFKISGRYYLSEKFDYSMFDCPYHVVKSFDVHHMYTSLYKLDKTGLLDYYYHLNSVMDSLYNCIAYERQFCNFIKKCSNVKLVDTIGIKGKIAVSNDITDA